MSALKISAIKSKYMTFIGYQGETPQFTEIEYLHVVRTFDTEPSAARLVVDDLIKNWNVNTLGTVPEYFRIQTLTTDKLYHVRPSSPGETPDVVSPSLGDYYFKPSHSYGG